MGEEEGVGRERFDEPRIPIGSVPPPKVARRGSGVSRGAVVRSEEGEDLLPPRVPSRHHDPCLVRFCPGAREHGRPQRPREDFRHELVQPRADLRNPDPAVHEGQGAHLVVRRVGNLLRQRMSQVRANGLAGPVQVFVALVVVQVHALPVRQVGDPLTGRARHPRHQEGVVRPRMPQLVGAPRSQRLKVSRVDAVLVGTTGIVALGLRVVRQSPRDAVMWEAKQIQSDKTGRSHSDAA
jgi:hypothetical protein